MDWEMKRMDGLEATRRIVKNYPNARIVIVTQHSDAELRAAAAEAGAAGYMLKDDLINLRRLLLQDQKMPTTTTDRARCSNDII
jgi:DNA-binding NarL/FixJ family response regulator